MTDIEKAIKGLEEISDYFDIYRNEKNDYYSPAQDYYNAAENAIALLKQQEAAYQGAEELLRQKTILFDDAITRLKKQEATMVIESENMYTGLPITHCPTCGKSLDRYLYGRQHEGEINFCPYCGQALKWE